MKSNPLISTPVALGLLAVGASQVFNLVASFVIDREQAAVEQKAAVVHARVMQEPGPEPPPTGADRTVTLQALRLVDPEGYPVISLSGVDSGALFAMWTPKGDAVADFGVGTKGEYFQTVGAEGDQALQFFVTPNGGTTLHIASPDSQSKLSLRLHEDGASVGWQSRLAMDERFKISTSLSLSGRSAPTREYLPGEFVSTLQGPSGSVLLGEHSLYSPRELRAAVADAAFASVEQESDGADPSTEPDSPTNPEVQP